MTGRKRWMGWIISESATSVQALPWQCNARRMRRPQQPAALQGA